MKVLFDLLPVSFSHHNGVFVYAQRILEGWHLSGITDVVVLTTPWLADSVLKPICPRYEYLTINVPCLGYTRKCLLVSQLRLKAINNSGCDIVFYPMPEPFFFQTPRIPQVTVIHDMAVGKYRWYQWKLMLPWQRYRSKGIIAITNYTKSKAIEVYPFLRKRHIDVVYNSVKFDSRQYAPLIDGKYILCVNTLHKYKNIDTLIKAVGLLKDKSDYKLVIVGADVDNRAKELKNLANKCGLSERYFHMSGIKDEDIVSLYQHASLFVTTSTIEGFGQTPIEAAIYKCPVITSKETALPESTLGLLNYYEPVYSEESLAKKIMEVLNNPPSQDAISEISNKMKKEYDIQSQSIKVWNVLVSNLSARS